MPISCKIALVIFEFAYEFLWALTSNESLFHSSKPNFASKQHALFAIAHKFSLPSLLMQIGQTLLFMFHSQLPGLLKTLIAPTQCQVLMNRKTIIDGFSKN